jgi:hypothetical protein
MRHDVVNHRRGNDFIPLAVFATEWLLAQELLARHLPLVAIATLRR